MTGMIRRAPTLIPAQAPNLLPAVFADSIRPVPHRPLRVAFVGNSLPRRCGIATFTTDLEHAVNALPDVAETAILAMCDPGQDYDWPASVQMHIDQDSLADYAAAAEFINHGGFDVVCLQHEFGIFGGAAGNFVLGLLAALTVPVVTTLHTVLASPTATQRVVMTAILARSARVVVMARMGRAILTRVYDADPARIVVIAHGIPDAPLESSDRAKRQIGFAGRDVMLTFGLIGPGKGIETMIEAMPAIVAAAPDAVYVVMGATHPHLLREAGEAYRHGLMARVRALKMGHHVVFINRFVDRPELLEHIAMCDIYVTPYLEAAQLTSGTLAWSHGQGRPVVSTPYWHAAELLADGSGMLVPFHDPDGLAAAVITLLCDRPARLAMGRKAYAASRSSVWAQTAQRYVECFRSVCRKDRLHIVENHRGIA
jgi:glycosyltransferase involved in cell wall biosynthesis